MNKIPNAITSVRLISAMILFVFSLANLGLARIYFLPLFCAAGISDMLDGFIARRFNWCTDFGAKLDSISDLSLYISSLLFLSLTSGPILCQCGALIVFAFALQMFHLGLSFHRFGQFPAYHTNFSRFCAYLIFFGVIGFQFTHSITIIAVLTSLWIACTLEGITITMLLERAHIDLWGIGAAIQLRRDERSPCSMLASEQECIS